LIEVAGRPAIESLANNAEVLMALHEPFERIIRDGYKLDDKCLRNEICVLMNYVVSCPQSHKLYLEKYNSANECVLDSIINYATFDELDSSGKSFFTTSEEDVELKKLLWT